MLRTSLGGILLAAVSAIHAACAAPGDTAAAIDRAIATWMATSEVESASVAVSFRGETVGLYGHGGWTPHQPHLLASLSKAITAVCVARLIDEKKLSLADTLGTVLAKDFRKFGEPADPRFKDITIAQLLSHRAGVARSAAGAAPTLDVAFAKVLRAPLVRDPGTAFEYSNSGYLVLGVVAKSFSGEAYQKQCLPVLTGVGATGFVDTRLAERAPNGGWSVSAADYIKFLRYFDPGSNLLGPVTRQYLRAPGAWRYSLGAQLQRSRSGLRLVHSGQVHHDLRHMTRGGSYYVVDDSGYAVVVIFSGTNPPEAYRALAAALEQAIESDGSAAPRSTGAMAGPSVR